MEVLMGESSINGSFSMAMLNNQMANQPAVHSLKSTKCFIQPAHTSSSMRNVCQEPQSLAVSCGELLRVLRKKALGPSWGRHGKKRLDFMGNILMYKCIYICTPVYIYIYNIHTLLYIIHNMYIYIYYT